MSCTIDHLSRDHRFRLLQDFEDARGVHHAQGESGIIRDMGLDWDSQEIWIDWERDHRRERLYFKLRSQEGPGNGRMKLYFELEQPAHSDPSPLTPNPVLEPDPHPHHPRTPVSRPSASPLPPPSQPSTSICLNESKVACACDPAFHRNIYPTGNLLVNACLQCGTVTVAHSVGDDGRYTGNAWTAYWTDPVPTPVLEWLQLWPRVQSDLPPHSIPWPMSADFVEYTHLVYPPNTRCNSITQLSQLESKLSNEQRNLSFAQKLRPLIPTDHPIPQGLPRELLSFVDLWQVARLRPTSDLNTLIHLAQLRSAASDLAADLLLQRPDALPLTITALQSDDPQWNSAGHAMARRFKSPPPSLFQAIHQHLDSLPLTLSEEVPDRLHHARQFESLLILLIRLKASRNHSEIPLRKLQSRVARLDPFLVSCIQTTISLLNPP